MKTNTKLLFLFLALIALDQSAKKFFSAAFCNKNIAWSIPVAPAVFYLVWTAIIVVLVCTFFKTKKYGQKVFLAIIFAGAISNMIDRIKLGCIVDYIDLKIFPVFNLADIYITAGAIFLIAINLKKYKIPDTKY